MMQSTCAFTVHSLLSQIISRNSLCFVRTYGYDLTNHPSMQCAVETMALRWINEKPHGPK